MRLYIAFYLLVIVLLQACNTTKPLSSDDLIFEMEKTACFGTCPVYTISIYKDRVVRLNAQKNLPMTGSFKGELSSNKFDELINRFLGSDFFEWDDRYVGNMTDLPTTYITFNHKGTSKRIMDYYGAPEELKLLENSLHLLIEEMDWKQIKGRN